MLLLLQNRGRQTSAERAHELEVAQRTILRDVDALTQAGLPIIVHQGNRGGIELGFNDRSRLTGLAVDAAEAMAVLLALPTPELDDLGLASAGQRARSKIIAALPDATRETLRVAQPRFRVEPANERAADARIEAMAGAIRHRCVVELQFRSASPLAIHPVGLAKHNGGWCVKDALDPGRAVLLADWGDINVAAQVF